MVTTLGRGGMFVATDDDFTAHTLQHCSILLPESGESIACDAEVIYCCGSIGGGVGVRFNHFEGNGENPLIGYLSKLEPEQNASHE